MQVLVGQMYSTGYGVTKDPQKVLSDDEKRSIYDRYGEAGLKGSGMGTGYFSNPFDLFETLFEGMGGGMGSRGSWNGAVDGEDEYYSLVLNFKEAVFGVEKEIEVRRLENRGTCNGSGAKPGTTSSRCGTCGGQGRVVSSTRTPLGIFQKSMTCSSCNGTGETRTPCSTCSSELVIIHVLLNWLFSWCHLQCYPPYGEMELSLLHQPEWSMGLPRGI